MHIILLGPPGSGKGSQAELLQDKYNLKHVAMGEILREEIRKKTSIGRKIEPLLKEGSLAPDDIVDRLASKYIKKTKKFVLDGYPRHLSQAKYLYKITKIDLVLLLKVPDSLIMKRLSNRRVCICGETYNLITKKPKRDLLCDKCGKKLYHRKDDKPKTIRKRLKIYEKETMPVINHYKNKKLLTELNAEKNIETVFNKISNILDKKGLYK